MRKVLVPFKNLKTQKIRNFFILNFFLGAFRDVCSIDNKFYLYDSKAQEILLLDLTSTETTFQDDLHVEKLLEHQGSSEWTGRTIRTHSRAEECPPHLLLNLNQTGIKVVKLGHQGTSVAKDGAFEIGLEVLRRPGADPDQKITVLDHYGILGNHCVLVTSDGILGVFGYNLSTQTSINLSRVDLRDRKSDFDQIKKITENEEFITLAVSPQCSHVAIHARDATSHNATRLILGKIDRNLRIEIIDEFDLKTPKTRFFQTLSFTTAIPELDNAMVLTGMTSSLRSHAMSFLVYRDKLHMVDSRRVDARFPMKLVRFGQKLVLSDQEAKLVSIGYC